MDQAERKRRSEVESGKPTAPKDWDAGTDPDAAPPGTRERDPAGDTTPLDALEPATAGTSKGGPGNWGVAGRWFVFAILAILFIWALYVFLYR